MPRAGGELAAWLKEPVKLALTDAQYELLERIGGGGYGHVYKCKSTVDGGEYAVKIEEPIFDREMRQSQEKRLRREIRIHQKLLHPNVVKFHEAIEIIVDTDSRWPIIVMELVTCDNEVCTLKDLLQHQTLRWLSEDCAAAYFREILRSVEYMHIVMASFHRDIKLENALVNDQGMVKLCDFGLSKDWQDSAAKTRAGSPQYLAPELARDNVQFYDGAAVDMWCCGVLLYNLVSGHTPFDRPGDGTLSPEERKSALRERILDTPLKILRPRSVKEDSMCWDLIKKLLQEKPAERATIDQVKCHSYFTMGADSGWLVETNRLLEAAAAIEDDDMFSDGDI